MVLKRQMAWAGYGGTAKNPFEHLVIPGDEEESSDSQQPAVAESDVDDESPASSQRTSGTLSFEAVV
jgi:hypothetical protein